MVTPVSEKAFAVVGRKLDWKGKGADEVGLDAKTGTVLVAIDPRYFRPTEVNYLLGDAAKARRELGWSHRVTFDQLIKEMVQSDLKLIA